jgi:hypothetical protein
MTRRLAFLALLLLAGCATQPDFDPIISLEVTEFTPASQPFGFVTTGYAGDWSAMEACSGLTGNLADVRFYVVTDPTVTTIITPWGQAGAVYLVGRHAVLFTRHTITDAGTVRHEMLHALLRRGGHPAVFDRCGVRLGALP